VVPRPLTPKPFLSVLTCERMLKCVSATALGSPVEPEEYWSIAISERASTKLKRSEEKDENSTHRKKEEEEKRRKRKKG
jgi:phage/plasmid primase-like uncharacterized protein